MMDANKEYTFEEIVAALPENAEMTCIVDRFLSSLEFIKAGKEFKTVDIQRYLRCGYGDACRIIDALVLLGVAERTEDIPPRYIVKVNQNRILRNKLLGR